MLEFTMRHPLERARLNSWKKPNFTPIEAGVWCSNSYLFQKVMSDVEDNRLCTYIYSVSCSLVAEILMIFGYSNNAWLVLADPDSSKQFLRGLNDDCFKSDTIQCVPWTTHSTDHTPFPDPFQNVTSPNAAMYIALYTARTLLIIQFLWFTFCIVCCCNVKAEQLARQHERRVVYFCAAGVLLFALLFLIIVITRFTGSLMSSTPQNFERGLGSGFWLFAGGGTFFFILSVFFAFREHISTFLLKFRSHQSLPHNEMVSMPT
ncbi:unnamed protein product [Cylicocyclus nassatus]|uniref:Uncharacterized protein n=1 Tax=Cylicocyclus nassatus TaxID=53992 RepID=A0AA36HGM5_CYLNA|nr:unnamed protein product [Cylicocyclus nassatus]